MFVLSEGIGRWFLDFNDFTDLCEALMYSPAEFDAAELHYAMEVIDDVSEFGYYCIVKVIWGLSENTIKNE